jgi:eukaryotic-like serine/threonine-protein kinase
MDTHRLIGQQVDRYQVTGHLARGGMADVYLAEDVDLGRKVALKVMLNALAADEQYVQRFRREAQTVARLDHPNIVQVYGTGLTPDGRPYIAIQYIAGRSLRDTLLDLRERGKLLPTSQALGIVRQIAGALGVAHAAGVVHRDIKPSNILIRPDGIPVLVDLGIASVQGDPRLTQTGSMMGTPHYMSPEQVRGTPLDGRSDLYSLGVILYELLAGSRPFDAVDSIAVLHKQVYEPPLPLDRVRTGLAPQTREIVAICLQKEPERRFQTATALVTAVDQALRAEGDAAAPVHTTVWLPEQGEDDLLSRRQVTREPTATRRPLPSAWPLYALASLAAALLVWFALLGPAIAERSLPTPTSPVVTALPSVEVVTAATNAPTIVPTSTKAPIPAPLPTATDTATPEPTPTETATPEPTPEPVTSEPGVELIGRSGNGIPIEVARFGDGPRIALFIGGLHAGYAPNSVALAQRAIAYFRENPDDIPAGVTLYIIPSLNPDTPYDPGLIGGRLNPRGVDLNRNWDCEWTPDAVVLGNLAPGSGGPAPFSEPEASSLKTFVEANRPHAVVVWTARASGGLVSPGGCPGTRPVSAPLADLYGLAAGYRIGVFTSAGDMMNWLDRQGIPAVAVFTPNFEDIDWGSNLSGMLAVLHSLP